MRRDGGSVFPAHANTGDHGARIDSHPERELTATEPALCNYGLHIKREVDEGDGMIKPLGRPPDATCSSRQ